MVNSRKRDGSTWCKNIVRRKSRYYMYPYVKKAVNLILNGLSKQDIIEKSLHENIFQVQSETRKKEIATTVAQRIAFLDQYLLEAISKKDLQTSKIVALYALMKCDRLFFEFMNEVYKDKVLFGDAILSDRDFHLFFQTKAMQSDVISSWKDYTFYKLQQVYIRVLFEAGLIDRKKKGVNSFSMQRKKHSD